MENLSQEKYELNKHNHGIQIKLANDYDLANYIEKRILKDKLSPQAVLGEIKRNNIQFKTTICVQTLYNYIRNNVFLTLSLKHLPIASKLKKHKCKVVKSAPKGTSIELRPTIIDSRLEFGHWEMDCVESCKKSKDTLLCLTERLSRKEIILKMPCKTSACVVDCINNLEKKYGDLFSKVFKTITVDNGVEFSNYTGLEQSCLSNNKRTTVYYCHPYSSYERGSNERLNREIRRWYPKGTNFSKVSVADINKLERWLNNYPKKILNFNSSNNVFSSYLQNIC